MATHIHASAVIHPGATLGDNVTVGPLAVVEDQVVIGEGTTLGPHAVVMKYTTLGPRCQIHAHAVVGGWPQDLAFNPETESFVRVGAECVIREGVTIHRGTKPGTVTELGQRCFLMANSHVAHNGKLGNQVIMANDSMLGGYVEVGDQVFISGNSAVHQFVRIGRLAMISGMSAVSKDVPPFCLLKNQRLNVVAGLNVIGLRRAGFAAPERLAIKRAFHTLYRSGLNVTQALDQMEKDGLSGCLAEFHAFIKTSKRGICRFEGRHTETAAEEE